MAKGSRYHQKAKSAAANEEKIQNAASAYKAGEYTSVAAAADAFGISVSSCTTVWHRIHGKSKSHCVAHMTQQLLNLNQEIVLENWIKWFGVTGIPLSKRTIAPKVQALCGQKPSRRWIHRFLGRHPECTLGRPSGLDPKQARAFNFTTVNKHFEQLQDVFDGKRIPLRNLHNFDEIGVQLGGGRKGTGELYFFATRDKNHYKIKSDDLELVTILESICADGTAPIKPCFVFSGVHFCEEWFKVDKDILYVMRDLL
jgi:hypothetical protein